MNIVEEKLASEIFNSTKKIKYLRKVAIRKTKLTRLPDDFKPTIVEEPTVEEPTVEEPTVEEPTVNVDSTENSS